METMSTFDLLMGMDAKDKAVPTKKVDVKRLSKELGAKFIVTLKALPVDRFLELSQAAQSEDGTTDLKKNQDINCIIVAEAMVDPDVRNKELMTHFKAATPADVVRSFLQAGEMAEMTEIVSGLCGFAKNQVEVVKN